MPNTEINIKINPIDFKPVSKELIKNNEAKLKQQKYSKQRKSFSDLVSVHRNWVFNSLI